MAINYIDTYDTYTYRTVQYIITTNKSSTKVIHYATTKKRKDIFAVGRETPTKTNTGGYHRSHAISTVLVIIFSKLLSYDFVIRIGVVSYI